MPRKTIISLESMLEELCTLRECDKDTHVRDQDVIRAITSERDQWKKDAQRLDGEVRWFKGLVENLIAKIGDTNAKSR